MTQAVMVGAAEVADMMQACVPQLKLQPTAASSCCTRQISLTQLHTQGTTHRLNIRDICAVDHARNVSLS